MPKVRLSEDLTPISDFRVRTVELIAKVKETSWSDHYSPSYCPR